MKRIALPFSILALLAFTIISCEEKEPNPDISTIEVDYQIYRFDRDLAKLEPNNIEAELAKLKDKYGDFYTQFFSKILPLRNESPEIFNESLSGFLTDQSIRKLLDTVDLVFHDFEKTEKDFDQSYKLLKYYLPTSTLPDLYTIVSEYSFQLIETRAQDKDAIVIGLDMFLGSNYPYEKIDPRNPAFSSYLVRRFNKDHLLKKSMELVIDEQLGKASGDRMLDIMIHNGKRLYLLDKILPHVHDSVIMEYTLPQLKWAESNEVEMWAFFFKKELFYKTNRMEINKYINVSPQSPGMPMVAPGRTANYIGWKIIQAFMKRNPDLTMSDLIQLKDAQEILNKSRFKPKK